MEAIIRQLGFPDNQDVSFVSAQDARAYLSQKFSSLKTKRCKLEAAFPDVNQDLVALLKSLLEFNPHYRATAAEALKHRVFDQIRVEQFELPSQKKIVLEGYLEENFDY